MLPLFPALRVLEIVLYVADMALALVMKNLGGNPKFIILFAMSMVFAIAFGVRIFAVVFNQNKVNLLHRNLDPEAFIQEYEPLLKTAGKNGNLNNTVRNYLSTGYAAKADYETAEKLLLEAPEAKAAQKLRGEGLRLTNLANLYLHSCEAGDEARKKKDIAKAEQYIQQLETLLKSEDAKGVGADMPGNLFALRTHLQALRGWELNEKYLVSLADKNTVPYFRIDSEYQLAVYYMETHRWEEALARFDHVAETAPKLHRGQLAAKHAEEIRRNTAEAEKAEKAPDTENLSDAENNA